MAMGYGFVLKSADGLGFKIWVGIRHKAVHQHATILPNLCPVKAWAKAVQCVLSYPGCNTDYLVSTVLTNDRQRLVTSTLLITQLQAATKRIGPNVLAFLHLDVGSHSIFSSGAMTPGYRQLKQANTSGEGS
jgi:hypothetical protein